MEVGEDGRNPSREDVSYVGKKVPVFKWGFLGFCFFRKAFLRWREHDGFMFFGVVILSDIRWLTVDGIRCCCGVEWSGCFLPLISELRCDV